MALKAQLYVVVAIVAAQAIVWISSPAKAQVMPHRAAPICNGQCGTPLTGPCTTETPYAYVPTRWRKWPVVQTAAFQPEEIGTPTPAVTPTKEEPLPESSVPELPMTPELPEPATAPAGKPATPLTPPFGDLPSAPPFDSKSQVPVFGDEPQAPPSAAGPSSAPFNDEPPQPPAGAEQRPMETETAPSAVPPTAPPPTPGAAPTEAPPAPPGTGMPFDVGPPQMPSDDPFKDDPDQSELFEPKSGTNMPSARQGNDELAQLGNAEASRSDIDSGNTANSSEPRLLRADGGSIDAARIPSQSLDSNPLRQASHPIRRTVAAESPGSPKNTASTWRRNPLRAN
jgi:hypothetical protein